MCPNLLMKYRNLVVFVRQIWYFYPNIIICIYCKLLLIFPDFITLKVYLACPKQGCGSGSGSNSNRIHNPGPKVGGESACICSEKKNFLHSFKNLGHFGRISFRSVCPTPLCCMYCTLNWRMYWRVYKISIFWYMSSPWADSKDLI